MKKKIELNEIHIKIEFQTVTDSAILQSDTSDELAKLILIYLHDVYNISFGDINDINISIGYKEA